MAVRRTGRLTMYPVPLSLADRQWLHPLLLSRRFDFSDFSFANLYLFRDSHRHGIIRDDQDVFISGRSFDGLDYLMPLSEPTTWRLTGFARFSGDYKFLFPVSEESRSSLSADFRVEAVDGDSDYIFEVNGLLGYRGGSLHGQKNLMKQFLRDCDPVICPFAPALQADALGILEAWMSESGKLASETDYVSCREALVLANDLGLRGSVCFAAGKPAGFLLGEELNSSMFTVHFAKGLRRYKGIYPFLFHQLAVSLQGRYKYLNLQQDLGQDSLRRAKSAYQPKRLLVKYRAYI